MGNGDKSDRFPDDIVESVKKISMGNINWRRSLSQDDINYLIDRAPFLQIIDTALEAVPLSEVKIIKSESGWNIHYYGDAMSSSPGLLLLGGGDYRIRTARDRVEDSDSSMLNPGKGTLRNQAFITASEMIRIAKQENWQGVHIIDGHELMRWVAWMVAKDYGLPLLGYTPNELSEQKLKRLKRSRAELDMVISGISHRR